MGIPEHEDKIVQKGISKVLNAIYENDFLNSSVQYRKVERLSSTRLAQEENEVSCAKIKTSLLLSIKRNDHYIFFNGGLKCYYFLLGNNQNLLWI
nr:hypothetical protein [Niallia taxi]